MKRVVLILLCGAVLGINGCKLDKIFGGDDDDNKPQQSSTYLYASIKGTIKPNFQEASPFVQNEAFKGAAAIKVTVCTDGGQCFQPPYTFGWCYNMPSGCMVYTIEQPNATPPSIYIVNAGLIRGTSYTIDVYVNR